MELYDNIGSGFEFQKFVFKGKVHLWRYLEHQSNYPGINFTADKDGCDSLIDLLIRLESPDYKQTKRLPLHTTTEKITAVGISNCKFKSYSALTLHFINQPDPIWTIEEELNDEIKISFSGYYLNELKKAIEKVKSDEGDFRIADKNRKNILYFWWYTGN